MPRFDADLALTRRVLSGDEAAFSELFEAMFPRLYRFALARLDQRHDAAEEAAQATLCLAMRKLHTYRAEASLFTWLCTLCRHEIYAWVKRNGRVAQVDLIEDVPEIRAALESWHAFPDTGAVEAENRAHVAAVVQRVLDVLPAKYASALEWKYLHDLPVREIARRLDLGEKAAESLLTRARAAFRDACAGIDVGLDGSAARGFALAPRAGMTRGDA
jgi:RNA polymerase sigma-70 factor (ECF subfamily)